MLRFRRITFVCDNCGHRFKGADIELWATAYSQPLRCPNCGSYHTCPNGSSKSEYRDIWKTMDERRAHDGD
jgi:DNA-directed RNA polymerase subunit RPC12/RpoP